MPSRNRKKRSKQRAEYIQKQGNILSQGNKAKARARYKADPETKKASVRDSYKADPEKKASVRDSYNDVMPLTTTLTFGTWAHTKTVMK